MNDAVSHSYPPHFPLIPSLILPSRLLLRLTPPPLLLPALLCLFSLSALQRMRVLATFQSYREYRKNEFWI